MKDFICIADRVFFNKKIYEYGEPVTFDDELAERVNKNWFEPKSVYDEKQKVIVKKINNAENSNKTIKDVIVEAEEEKKKLKKEYEEKITSLEKQLNPKVKNGI